MDQARARFLRAVELGQKALKKCWKSPEDLCGSTGGGHTCPDGPREPDEGIPHASMGRSTGKRQPFENIGCFDGGSRKSVKPRCGATAGTPGEANPGIESSCVGFLSSVLSGGAAAVNAAEAGDADFSNMEADEQQLAQLEDTHALGGPGHVSASPQRHSGENASERASVTPPAKKDEDVRAVPSLLGRPTSSTGTAFVGSFDAFLQERRSRGSHAACVALIPAQLGSWREFWCGCT